MIMKSKQIIISMLIILLFSNCKDDEVSNPTVDTAKLKIIFLHSINNQTVELNKNIYINEAGNHYEINDIMYFISDVKLHQKNGNSIFIDKNTIAHYVDYSLPSTLSLTFADAIPAAVYDSISFVFGISKNKNISNSFVNPPESNMFWPEILGGGYHYMKINGKWLNQQNTSVAFNFHFGIGQIYTDTITYNVNTITSYVQNYFTVSLPLNSFQLTKNQLNTINLEMAIDKWFTTPHVWNHNYWGSSIMQNQRAQQTIRENAFDVFRIANSR